MFKKISYRRNNIAISLLLLYLMYTAVYMLCKNSAHYFVNFSSASKNVMVQNSMVYYINPKQDYLYTYNIDTKEETVIIREPLTDFFIQQDYMLVQQVNGLFRCNLDGTDKQCVESSASGANSNYIYDNFLALGEDKIFFIRTHSTSNEKYFCLYNDKESKVETIEKLESKEADGDIAEDETQTRILPSFSAVPVNEQKVLYSDTKSLYFRKQEKEEKLFDAEDESIVAYDLYEDTIQILTKKDDSHVFNYHEIDMEGTPLSDPQSLSIDMVCGVFYQRKLYALVDSNYLQIVDFSDEIKMAQSEKKLFGVESFFINGDKIIYYHHTGTQYNAKSFRIEEMCISTGKIEVLVDQHDWFGNWMTQFLQ